MSKLCRLTKKRDFQLIFEHSRKIKGRFFYALCRKNALSAARLGMIFSKRYIKHAVCRNLLKRIVRESFRAHQERLKGFDMIVLKTPHEYSLDKKRLRKDIDDLMKGLQ